MNKAQKQFVTLMNPPFTREQLLVTGDSQKNKIREKAFPLPFCEDPHCSKELDIRGIMRRVMVGNVVGAKRLVEKTRCYRGDPANM